MRKKQILKTRVLNITAVALISAMMLMGCGAESLAGNVAAAIENASDSESDYESTTVVSEDVLAEDESVFSDRDLEQEADLTDATEITLTSGEDVTISSEGVYHISGNAEGTTIIVEAADTDKVQLVLDGVTITNTNAPAIYVKSADKVFVTITGDNNLSVSGAFAEDGTTNVDAVIFSKDDLVLNGTGTLTVSSTANGITCKDDLKITGGTYEVTSTEDAFEANDSISISDGSFDIDSKKDAFHCEDSDDDTVGSIYIADGTFNIEAGDDGIQATTTLTIDGGTFDITAVEGLEATYIQINDGTINISASDDGINATQKSTAYDVLIEVNGGDITVVMGAGDTDGFDANGSIIINGGTIDVTCNSAFDFDNTATLNGGTVIINGEEVTEITNSMMGPGGMGGRGGMGGGFNGQMPEDGQTPPDFNGQTPPDFGGQMPGEEGDN
jgi:hypothetical protein